MGGLSPSVTRVLGYRLIIVTWWVGKKRPILALRNYAMAPYNIIIIYSLQK